MPGGAKNLFGMHFAAKYLYAEVCVSIIIINNLIIFKWLALGRTTNV